MGKGDMVYVLLLRRRTIRLKMVLKQYPIGVDDQCGALVIDVGPGGSIR